MSSSPRLRRIYDSELVDQQLRQLRMLKLVLGDRYDPHSSVANLTRLVPEALAPNFRRELFHDRIREGDREDGTKGGSNRRLKSPINAYKEISSRHQIKCDVR